MFSLSLSLSLLLYGKLFNYAEIGCAINWLDFTDVQIHPVIPRTLVHRGSISLAFGHLGWKCLKVQRFLEPRLGFFEDDLGDDRFEQLLRPRLEMLDTLSAGDSISAMGKSRMVSYDVSIGGTYAGRHSPIQNGYGMVWYGIVW